MKSTMHHQFENDNDEALFERIIEGDKEAFAVLYDRHAPTLYGLAMKLLGNQTAAADALQDVFLRIWQKKNDYLKRRGHPVAWMAVICRNHCIDLLRSQSAVAKKTVPFEEMSSLPRIDDHETSPAHQCNLAQLRQAVENALATLTNEQGKVIRFALEKGMTQSEIAQSLDIPIGTVKSRMRLGMAKLRKALLAYMEA